MRAEFYHDSRFAAQRNSSPPKLLRADGLGILSYFSKNLRRASAQGRN
jgi:hypothetical protein